MAEAWPTCPIRGVSQPLQGVCGQGVPFRRCVVTASGGVGPRCVVTASDGVGPRCVVTDHTS